MTQTKKEKILYFIRSHRLGVLATVTRDISPQAAVVGIHVRDNLEVLFATYDQSRKAHNLKSNPKVALVVGWEQGKTVQYEGTAEELKDEELESVKSNEFANMPSSAKHVKDYEQKFYKLIPHWIRYSNISSEPWEKIELSLL